MTVKSLIELLLTMPQDLQVQTWDDDINDWVTVTGAIWEDGLSTVDLITEHW